MSTWFKVSQYGKPEITTVEVVKETTKFITYLETYKSWRGPSMADETRETRSAKDEEFFPTFTEARRSLMKRFENKIAAYQREVELAKKYLQAAYDMEGPSERV